MTGDWVEPWDPDEPLDVEACTRKLEFTVGWFADPIYFGKYPQSMVDQLGARLPDFTADEIAVLQGSNDYYGMNQYTANYIKHKTGKVKALDFFGHLEILMENKFGHSIGPKTQSFWLHPHPVGFRKMFNWLDNRYGRPKFFVTENGTSILGENDLPVEKILQDDFRVRYFRDYIAQMVDAKCEDGINVVGYVAWSLLEYVFSSSICLSARCFILTCFETQSNFEWAEGYGCRFGVTYVDYANGQERYPKKSAMVIGEIFRDLIDKSEERL
jgi:beta-glucosidase